MTLVEVVVALAVSGLAVAGVVNGYIYSVASAERSALSGAANARASERLEQTHAATWITSTTPPVDQLAATNFPPEVVTLDQAATGNAITYATNFTQIFPLSTNPPVRCIRVDCVWTFDGTHLLTNTLQTCRSPDQ
ncbi:conserved exported hypothetical protein [Verrucomicrobia bacterium]|nr:conserved exported hypothetical protein [Verrucomicrobiota bacterium]